MNTLNEIREFLEPKKIAIAGASRNPKKFGGAVVAELKNKGFELYPVNPNADEIQGFKCYHSVAHLPEDVKNLHIVTKKTETAKVVQEAVNSGIEKIWIQQGSETPEALEIAAKNNLPVISRKCIMMFSEPVSGIHGFHRFLAKTFGGYPKMIKS